MKILYQHDWVKSANEWLARKTGKDAARSIYLPAGETSKRLYANWRESPPYVLDRLELYQLDDIIEGNNEAMFARYFANELPELLVFPPETSIRADLGILGLGSNGHVAFHEPGIPPSFEFGEVKLTASSSAHLGVKPKTLALTYGVGALLMTKALLLIITGQKKLEVFKEAVGLNENLPVTHIMKHPDLTVLIDV